MHQESNVLFHYCLHQIGLISLPDFSLSCSYRCSQLAAVEEQWAGHWLVSVQNFFPTILELTLRDSEICREIRVLVPVLYKRCRLAVGHSNKVTRSEQVKLLEWRFLKPYNFYIFPRPGSNVLRAGGGHQGPDDRPNLELGLQEHF